MSAAMKTVTVTSSQFEDIRAALVEHRGRMQKYHDDARHSCTREYWAGLIRRIDEILLLVAKA